MGIETIGLALLGGLGSAVASKVLAPRQSSAAPTPTPPTITPPTIMPIADSVEVATARKKSMLTQNQRSGRASTILSGDSNSDKSTTLGG